MVKIAGSFLKIQEDTLKIKELDNVCDIVHFDIMDGKFTERPTLKVEDMIDKVKDLKKKIDIHLMVNDIEKYIYKILPLKPYNVTIHSEVNGFEKGIKILKKNNINVGLAINPDTLVEVIYPYLNQVNLVLVMSVVAGKGGQPFIDITDKINKLIEYRKEHNLNFLIEVDGGINDKTISKVKNADIVVVGSFITDSDNYKTKFYQLKKALRNGFTLAELLAVIVILSILGLIAITTVDKSLKESRYDSCKVQEKNLIEGAKMVVIDYPKLLPTSGEITINVAMLQNGGTINGVTIDGGYIEDDLVNPMTDKPYVTGSNSNVSVKIKLESGSNYSYEVVYSNDNEKCSK